MSIHKHERTQRKHTSVVEFTHPRVDSRSFTDRLNALFSAMRESGATVTNAELSEALAEQGITCSPAYISQLRNGHRVRPSIAVAHGIANAFGVPRRYFHRPLAGVGSDGGGCIGLTSDAAMGLHLNTVALTRLLKNAALLPESTQELLADFATKLIHGTVQIPDEGSSGERVVTARPR